MKRVFMILKGCILSVFLMGMAFGQQIQADNSKASVRFEIGSIHGTVKVNFSEFEADVKFDPNNLVASTISGKIKSASLDSKNGGRDGSLRDSKYLDVKNFPYMSFKSKKIVKVSNGYKAVGTMSIKGKSREFEMPFTFDGSTFKSSFELKFTDYGVSGGGFFHENDGKVIMEFAAMK
ncbi:MAG: YceI family protein [Bacteroidia bacterium]|nr:YceI family protein [Bacteroidia bacterium]